jgi:hypothetical protein
MEVSFIFVRRNMRIHFVFQFTALARVLGNRYVYLTYQPLEHVFKPMFTGWHQSINHYSAKIREVLAKMFAILPNITDINLSHFHKYLDQIYRDVTMVEASVNPCLVNEALQAKFSDYMKSEEERLRNNLETIRYDIDGVDTIPLITGAGRIGKVSRRVLKA